MARRCSSCNAPLRFVPSAKSGKPMPLDLLSDPDGNVEVANGVGHVLSGSQLAVARRSGTTLWMPHQATCPAVAARRAARQIDTDTGMQQGSLL